LGEDLRPGRDLAGNGQQPFSP